MWPYASIYQLVKNQSKWKHLQKHETGRDTCLPAMHKSTQQSFFTAEKHPFKQFELWSKTINICQGSEIISLLSSANQWRGWGICLVLSCLLVFICGFYVLSVRSVSVQADFDDIFCYFSRVLPIWQEEFASQSGCRRLFGEYAGGPPRRNGFPLTQAAKCDLWGNQARQREEYQTTVCAESYVSKDCLQSAAWIDGAALTTELFTVCI